MAFHLTPGVRRVSLEEAQRGIWEFGTGRALGIPYPGFAAAREYFDESLIDDAATRVPPPLPLVGIGLAAAGALVVWLLAR